MVKRVSLPNAHFTESSNTNGGNQSNFKESNPNANVNGNASDRHSMRNSYQSNYGMHSNLNGNVNGGFCTTRAPSSSLH